MFSFWITLDQYGNVWRAEKTEALQGTEGHAYFARAGQVSLWHTDDFMASLALAEGLREDTIEYGLWHDGSYPASMEADRRVHETFMRG